MREPRTAPWTAAVVAAAALLATGCGSTQEDPPPERPRAQKTTTGAPPAKAPASGQRKRPAAAARLDFEDDRRGRSAERFEPLLGEWVVREDASAPHGPRVYAQTSTQGIKPPETGAEKLFGKDYSEYLDKIKAYQVFPSTIYSGGEYGDMNVSVSFKPISGQVDQAGGIVFRVASPKDYYIWRCNVLEQNCELFIYEDGERRPLFQSQAPLKTGEWRRIRVVAKGDKLEGYLDERQLMDFEDGTFSRGRVGLWTKADAITNFDDFRVKPLR